MGCGAISVNPDSEILMITKAGQTIRCEVQNIRETSKVLKEIGKLSRQGCTCWSFEVIELDEEDLDHENRESSTVENAEVINSTESSIEVREEIDQD